MCGCTWRWLRAFWPNFGPLDRAVSPRNGSHALLHDRKEITVAEPHDIDGVLIQWGDRLFYPGNRIVKTKPQP